MPEIDYQQPSPFERGVNSPAERMFKRHIYGVIRNLPDSKYGAEAPSGVLGESEAGLTDRGAPFAGLPAVIAAGKGLVPGAPIDMRGYPIAGAATQESPTVTANLTMSVDKWKTYVGRFILCDSASPITITVDNSSITGTAQGGGAGATLAQSGGELPWITLAASASSANDTYNFMTLTITSGTGSGQTVTIVDYLGASRRAYILEGWTTVPSATSVYSIAPIGRFGGVLYQKGAGAVTVAATGGLTLRGGRTRTSGQYALAPLVQISSDLLIKGDSV